MTNTKTIARNSGWYGIEQAVGLISNLVTSIAIARTLGPSKNAYLVYISYIAYVASNLGSLGIPATTSKYMAEFIGLGDRGTARYIYFRTLLLQVCIASAATAGVLVWTLHDAPADYRLTAILIVLSIWPSMVNSISSMANMATEDLATNLPASIASTLVYFVAISASVVMHWGVVGIGAALFLMRAVDFLVRFFPTMKRILSWETTHAQPAGLSARMISFAWQSVSTMLASLIVWERFEVVLLRKLCPDVNQISYYNVAFSMADRLLLASLIFGQATAATIFVQYGRDKSRLPLITASTFRYLALMAIPLHFLAVSLAVPALLLLYGHAWAGAAAVATLAPLLCLPKAFIRPAQSILQGHERQSFVIWATVIAAAIDVGVTWWLVGTHGAVGACIGSGAAQFTAVGLMWAVSIKLYKVRLPWLFLAKVVLISTAASIAAHYVAIQFTPWLGLILGLLASVIVFFILFYLFRVLQEEDRSRFESLTRMLPGSLAKPASKLLSILVPAAQVDANPANV
jgi:O-antigen/teichoic acid export membrane protein